MISHIPLAEIMRAQTLEDVVGHQHLVGPEGVITKIVRAKKPLSLLLWGPPGVGKTTIARLYAQAFSLKCVHLSATSAKVSDIKTIIEEQYKNPLLASSVIVFLDEIHRFNKAQQDAFLPHVENGSIILVGATTENPSFSLNNALLSRLKVLTLDSLDNNALNQLLIAYEKKTSTLPLEPDARAYLLDACCGDGRTLFNFIESLSCETISQVISKTDLQKILKKHAALYDQKGDQHYNLISALHKAVRSSDPDAALYWLARMFEGGEDRLFIARRIIRMASEDIGCADPQALSLAIAARDSYQMLGSPEGELALAQTIVYLALAPKSNAVYVAFKKARELAQKTSHLPPPLHILNAPTRLMSDLGYGKNYMYDHDTLEGCSGAYNFPPSIKHVSLYEPKERGFEREMKKRLLYFAGIRNRVSSTTNKNTKD